MGFLEGFKRGYENDYEYEIADKTVTCSSHCGSTDFDEREGKVNTTGLTLLSILIGRTWQRARSRVQEVRASGVVPRLTKLCGAKAHDGVRSGWRAR